jgi:hypothetical protein
MDSKSNKHFFLNIFFWKVSRKDWLGNFPETFKVSGKFPRTSNPNYSGGIDTPVYMAFLSRRIVACCQFGA